MRNFLILAFILSSSLISLFANNDDNEIRKEVNITGQVIDKETNEPLEYATIAFIDKKENKITTGGITDVRGFFSIPVKKGVYDITIEYISFKKISIQNKLLTNDENLGVIKLELDIEALDAVEVIAERTTVEIKLDKKIYNVGKDLTVSGGTVSDVLDNVPSVSVDVEGNVSLRGNNNVRILINGKPSGLVGLNSTDALRQLPAESIEKVEVITSPSARYDAEGTAGILNIILRRSKLQGLNGAITTTVGHPSAAGVSGNINFRTGDLNIFNTTGYRYSKGPGHSYSNTRYFNEDFDEDGNLITNNPDTFSEESNDYDRQRKGFNTNFGVEWYINDSASLTTSVFYREGTHEHNTINQLLQFNENRELTLTSNRFDPESEDYKTTQYSANFTKNFKTSGHKFTFDFQYEDSNEDENSLVKLNNLFSERVTTLNDESRILLQTDYVLPIGEMSQFEMGFKGTFKDKSTDYLVERYNEESQDFDIDFGLSNLFNFREYINAVYSQYGSKFNKFSFLLGLRLENSQITIDQPTSGDFKKKNYTGLFPTINLNYELSENENITLGYSRRLRRTHSYFINPFPSRSSVTNIFQGNPDLDPTYSGTFDLGYLNRFGKFTLSTSIYYQHATDVFTFISSATGDYYIPELNETITENHPNFDQIISENENSIAVIQRSPINLATNDRYGFEFNLTYSPSRKWRINTDFNFFKSITKGDYNGVNYDADNLSWRARLSNKYTLPGNIDWQTTIGYRGPSENAQNKYKGSFSTNMALSKDLFKEKASIALNVSDLFNSRKRKSETLTDIYSSEGEFQWRERNINLSFTYRFNQKKKRQQGMRQDGGDQDMEF